MNDHAGRCLQVGAGLRDQPAGRQHGDGSQDPERMRINSRAVQMAGCLKSKSEAVQQVALRGRCSITKPDKPQSPRPAAADGAATQASP